MSDFNKSDSAQAASIFVIPRTHQLLLLLNYLISPFMVKYFRDLSTRIDREKMFTPITLAVKIAGIYEHHNTRIQLNPFDVPDQFTTQYVIV